MKPIQIKNLIYGDLKKTGTQTDIVSRALGISQRCFYARMKDPGTFTAREIRILRKFCSEETCDAITR